MLFFKENNRLGKNFLQKRLAIQKKEPQIVLFETCSNLVVEQQKSSRNKLCPADQSVYGYGSFLDEHQQKI